MAETKIICPHCNGKILLRADTSKRIIAEKVPGDPPPKPKPVDSDDIVDQLLGSDDGDET